MRLKLQRRLEEGLTPHCHEQGARPVLRSDREALAALMACAYRGTIDDAGEGFDGALAEVDRLWDGVYGPFNLDASEVVEREKVIASATLVSAWDGLPLIAFSLTAPPWQRRGLARGGIVRAMHRLRSAGASMVQLAVTQGNTPAQRLYASLGFVEVK